MNKENIVKKPITSDGNRIIENRRCHLCESQCYIEKVYNPDKKTTSYRCTNCDNIIWIEQEHDFEMFPQVFYDEFIKTMKEMKN